MLWIMDTIIHNIATLQKISKQYEIWATHHDIMTKDSKFNLMFFPTQIVALLEGEGPCLILLEK